jgi:hypothetical protein
MDVIIIIIIIIESIVKNFRNSNSLTMNLIFLQQFHSKPVIYTENTFNMSSNQ